MSHGQILESEEVPVRGPAERLDLRIDSGLSGVRTINLDCDRRRSITAQPHVTVRADAQLSHDPIAAEGVHEAHPAWETFLPTAHSGKLCLTFRRRTSAGVEPVSLESWHE